MDEFALIREVVNNLGDRAQGRWIALGPGDDAAVIDQSPDTQVVASIDTLVSGVHFPTDAAPELIGYRALMVSLSDLAAMAATPRYVLVALTLPNPDGAWVGQLARGMASAAEVCDTYLCGGNFARGPLSITVSVHGEVPDGQAVTRAGARVGDQIYVSGPLGGAAGCVREADFFIATGAELSARQQRYYRPRARFDLMTDLRSQANAAIDVSDGLLVDLAHMCAASEVQARISSKLVPVFTGAQLDDALFGGDDYEILCTARQAIPGMIHIGEVTAGSDVLLDNNEVDAKGYNHFES